MIVEGDDRYGEGVNIAARLQQLAEPGGICVSGKVAREVEKKLAFGFEPMGEQKVKNIAEPVQAFSVVIEGQARRQPMLPLRPNWVWAGAVVLPLLLHRGRDLLAVLADDDRERQALGSGVAFREPQR